VGEDNRRAKVLDPALSPRALYGAELRYYRERAGLSQAQLARLIYVTPSFVANLEAGRRRMQPELAAVLDELLDTRGFFVRNLAAGRSTTDPDRAASTTPLESRALTVREWDAVHLPALLRTEEYATALARATDLPRVAALPRARSDRARHAVVVTETALRRTVGSAATMAAQLRYVATLVREDRLTLRVLPLATAPHTTTQSAFKLLTFPDDVPAGYVHGRDGWTLSTEPGLIDLLGLTYDLLRDTCLPPEPSLDLVEAVAMGLEVLGP
jgi:transcriptional regulator with XRE-family HTH domain